MEQPKLIKSEMYNDHRGRFAPLQLSYANKGDIDKNWLQSNISISDKKWTIRGLHFQNGEYAQSKLIKVIQGEILDFVVDLRFDSETYLDVKFYDLSDNNALELYIPKGFAHGFITRTDNTIVQYLVDAPYSPESEGCLYWKELPIIKQRIGEYIPDFDEDNVIISDKDKSTYNMPELSPLVEELVEELIKKYPNDMELGKQIRKHFNPF